jgi:hypothetical protein
MPPLLDAYIPPAFARTCRILYYSDLVILVVMAWIGGRAGLVALAPLYAMAAFILWILGHWIRLAARHDAFYRLDDSGVRDRSYLAAGMQVPWDDIERVERASWLGFSGLRFHLRAEAAQRHSLSPLNRLIAAINRVSYGSPLVLWQAWSDVSLDIIQQYVDARQAARTDDPLERYRSADDRAVPPLRHGTH